MKTAVQLRTLAGDERPRAELLFGTPCDLGEGMLGPVARFESGEVVAYHPEPSAPAPFRLPYARGRRPVPGVRPRVQLLMELRTAGRIRLVRSLFAYLIRTGRDPSALPDLFYTRVGVMLGGRLPAHKVLLSLLHARHPSDAQEPNAALKAEGVSPARALARPTAGTGKPF